MERIMIVGSGGSGKSYLARRLGKQLGLPVTHLDAIYFSEDWTPLQQEAFAAEQRSAVAGSRWIIDGNHYSTMDIRLREADTVVFTDVPAHVALWGILVRQARYGAGHHGNGVHNRLNWTVVRYVASYRSQMRPKVLAKIAQYPHLDCIRLRSRREATRWLQALSLG